jgi:hypothetical protein
MRCNDCGKSVAVALTALASQCGFRSRLHLFTALEPVFHAGHLTAPGTFRRRANSPTIPTLVSEFIIRMKYVLSGDAVLE